MRPFLWISVVFLVVLVGATDAGAAIAFSASYGRAGTSTSAQVRPTTAAGVAAGNLYVAQIVVANGSCSSLGTPTGWTRQACDGHGGHIQAIYTRPAQTSDLNVTFSFPLGASRSWASVLLSYSGVDLVNPLDAGPSTNTYSNSKNAAAASITTQTPGAMAVLLTSASASSNKFFTPPSGWSERRERSCNNGVCRITAADRLYATPGATGAVTTTLKSNASGIVHLIALRPFSRAAYWPLDGINWLEDASGNGHVLTAQGGAMPISAKICTGFQGTGSQYLTAADSSLLDLPDRYTLAVWVYPTAYPSSDLKTILSKDENYELHLNTAGRLYWWWTESGGTTRTITSQSTIPLNQWTHIAVVFDRLAAGGRQRIYINGVQETATYSYGTAAQTNNDVLYIGSDVGYTSGSGNRNFLGLIDEVYIYSGALSAADIASLMSSTHPCAVDHYRLKIADGQALTCEAESVSIEACANADCTSSYLGSGMITVSANNGAKINGGASPQTIAFTNGFGSVSIEKGSAGVTTLGLSAASPAPTGVTGYRCFIGSTEVAWSACQINFQQAKLTIEVPDFTACSGASEATITAEGCGSAVSGNKNLKVWMSYVDPNTANGESLKIGSLTVPTSKPGTNNLVLSFDSEGTATLPAINYDDAGELALYAELTEGGLTLSGQGNFVVAPEKLKLSSTTGACPAADASCVKFKKAGEPFNLTLDALCSSGKVTRNFRMGSIPLARTRHAPDPGDDGSFAPTEVSLTAADNGQKTFPATISEVGVFSVTPGTINYKGVAVPGEGTGPLGRFYPDHFDTEVTNGCGSFTYSGQPFGLKVIAKNASGGTTQNYAGAFAKTVTLADANGANGKFQRDQADCSPANVCVLASDFSAGETAGLYDPNPKKISFVFSDKLTAPATIKVRAYDEDTGNTVVGTNEGTVLLRSGRLRLSNVFGPRSPLAMPIEAQYWSGASWVKNADDGCTTLSGIFSTPPTGWSWPASGSSATLSNGSGQLMITGPTSGSATVTASGVAGWLKSKWNGSPGYDQPPSAKATIGVQAPETKRTVHVRELH